MFGYNYQPQMMHQPSIDERIWVQNETSAEAYLVAPNGFVRLWDSQKPVFYEKRADATGRPMPMEAFSYAKIEPRNDFKSADDGIDYQKEIEAILRRIEALEKEARHESNADDTSIQSIPE